VGLVDGAAVEDEEDGCVDVFEKVPAELDEPGRVHAALE